MKKSIRIIFKNGTQVVVSYSSRVYAELAENLGKDHKIDAKNFSVNTKSIEGVFFEVESVEEASDAE